MMRRYRLLVSAIATRHEDDAGAPAAAGNNSLVVGQATRANIVGDDDSPLATSGRHDSRSERRFAVRATADGLELVCALAQAARDWRHQHLVEAEQPGPVHDAIPGGPAPQA
jgi:hypothetical protein